MILRARFAMAGNAQLMSGFRGWGVDQDKSDSCGENAE
jgi:hypothetical protein